MLTVDYFVYTEMAKVRLLPCPPILYNNEGPKGASGSSGISPYFIFKELNDEILSNPIAASYSIDFLF